MAVETLIGPNADHMPPNTTDETPERGWSFRHIIASLNTMLAELYSINAERGQTQIDFGAFPGVSDTSLAITGQTNIAADSVLEAWIIPAATDDHSADEHLVDPPRVMAGNISPGVGFTIYGITQNPQLAYGKWSVGWRWQ